MCFNPTRVRLKRGTPTRADAAQATLQPHKGPSETRGASLFNELTTGFNPTRVRLKPAHDAIETALESASTPQGSV